MSPSSMGEVSHFAPLHGSHGQRIHLVSSAMAMEIPVTTPFLPLSPLLLSPTPQSPSHIPLQSHPMIYIKATQARICIAEEVLKRKAAILLLTSPRVTAPPRHHKELGETQSETLLMKS